MTKGKPNREPPWAVRGITAEAKSAAAIAATKGGQTLGQWLNRVILDAASGELKHSRELGPTTEQMMQQLIDQMGQLTAKVDGMQQQAPARGGFLGLFHRGRTNNEKV